MAVPSGAIVNTVISLAKTTSEPSVSNVVGAASSAIEIFGNPEANTLAKSASPLVSSLANTLVGGSPFNALNATNQAVKLAQGFLDPQTANIVGSVSSGLNQLFGLGGVFNPFGIGGAGGNKPSALRTDTMTAQPMKAAYGEGQDVAFSFVRAGSALESDIFGDFGGPDFGSSIAANESVGGVTGGAAFDSVSNVDLNKSYDGAQLSAPSGGYF